jgi:MFS family permease
VNFADIAPAYSSIIFATTSTIATIGALGSNFIAGLVIKRPILEDWRKIFILFAIIHTIGGIVFVLFGSAVPRKWAMLNSEKDESLTMLPPQTNVPSVAEETKTKQSIHLPE